MGKIVLVTGGSRSGKSKFAENYIRKNEKNDSLVAYIATAQIFDDEMKYRVKLHRERRPANWRTYEMPFDAHAAIAEAKKAGCSLLLFDCLTIYFSNLICALPSLDDEAAIYRLAQEKTDALLKAAQDFDGLSVFVTNEVGSGIVPDNKLTRIYRDIAGLANQWTAAAADEVYLVACGLPIDLKKLAAAQQRISQ